MTALAGTGALVRLVLRRDRIRLPSWLVAILGLVYASAGAVQGTYNTPGDIAVYARTVGNSPASVVMNGPPTALDTIAGIMIFEINTSAIILTALMAIFLVVRHTRADEEEGRTELVRATVVGRYGPVAAALIVVAAACVLVGAGLGLELLALGLPPGGSIAYAASIAAVGIVFTAVAAVAAQVTEHARGALGIAGIVLGASFLVRGAGDIGDGRLSWLSPIGWTQAVRPFAGDRWWPLLLSLALSAILLAIVAGLTSRRDVGSGLISPRPGSPTASPRLTSAVGLAVRLQRASVLSWLAAMFVGGVAIGSVGQDVEELITTNPEIAEMLGVGAGSDIVDAFFATIMLVLALIATGFTQSSVLRLRSEESAGRAEPLLATGLSRWRWSLGSLLVTLLGTLLVLGAGGLGVGLAHGISTGDMGQLPRLFIVSLPYACAALVLAGVAVALFGWAPRLTPLAWAALAACFVFGWLGTVLGLPSWLTTLSPFSHVPSAPVEPITAGPLVTLTAVGLALTAVGLVGFRRRDLG